MAYHKIYRPTVAIVTIALCVVVWGVLSHYRLQRKYLFAADIHVDTIVRRSWSTSLYGDKSPLKVSRSGNERSTHQMYQLFIDPYIPSVAPKVTSLSQHILPSVETRSGRERPRHLDSEVNQPLTAKNSPFVASTFTPLSQDVVHGVEKYVFFVGYPRSGHTIIASMMDAHPNMIIAPGYDPFGKLMDPHYHTQVTNKSHLFNSLCEMSYFHSNGKGRTNAQKGYTIEVNTHWQGKFTKLRVIGDKIGKLVSEYYYRFPDEMKKCYSELVDAVLIPIKVMHVVRNPYDMIATAVLYHGFPSKIRMKVKASEIDKYNNSELVNRYTNSVFNEASGLKAMTEECNLSVLEMHLADFVRDPKKALMGVCDFLDLECPEDYLQVCYEKAFGTLSKTRNHVVWTEEALNKVEEEKRKYPFFSRYSFTSED